MKGKQNKVYI